MLLHNGRIILENNSDRHGASVKVRITVLAMGTGIVFKWNLLKNIAFYFRIRIENLLRYQARKVLRSRKLEFNKQLPVC